MKVEKNVRMYKRYSVILKHLQGMSNKKIAEMELLEAHAVGNYIKKYHEGGLSALEIKYSPGAPRKMTSEQEEKLVEIVTGNIPEDYMCNWTIAIIQELIKKEFNIKMCHSAVAVVLHRLNLSYTRPTYTLAKADEEKQIKFIEDFEVLKKIPQGEVNHILFQDESMIRDYQAIQKTWFIKGQQKSIPTYSKNAGVKLIGILDYVTGMVYCEEHEKYDAKVFLEFLKVVLEKYPTGKIVMILDNAKIHHAKLIQPFLNEMKDRLELMFLPPYSPNLNLIEGLWGWIKSSVINNSFFPIIVRVRNVVQKFITGINKSPQITIDRLCVRM
ncbi:MAG: IS630 family transposase [Paraclostridium sp.]